MRKDQTPFLMPERGFLFSGIGGSESEARKE
jgi:hypothetical protein